MQNNISDDEILRFLTNKGIIDVGSIKQQIEMEENQKYISMHPYAVWQNQTDSKWYTHIDNNGKRKLIKRTTREAMDTFLLELYKPLYEDPSLDKVAHSWLSDKLEHGDVSRQTKDRYENQYKRFFSTNSHASQIVNKKMKFITTEDLDNFLYPTLAEMKPTRKTFSDLCTILRGIFKYAKKRKYTDISISAYLSDMDTAKNNFTYRRKSPDEQYFSEEEEQLVLKHLFLVDDIRALGLVVAFDTGVRVGELATIKKSDIHGDCISISRTEIHYKDEDGRNVIDVQESTKTDAGTREVFLSPVGQRAVGRILELADCSEWLFSENGHRICASGFRRKLYRVCDALHIKCKSPHKIRKTYATKLMYAGVQEDVVKLLMGHTDIATTRRNYVVNRTSPELIRDQLKKVASN